jgi:hypothetical protein
MSNDWNAVEAAAQRAGWKLSDPKKSLWLGSCPVTGEEYCTVEPGTWASDGVLMECWAPSCLALGRRLGERYGEHKEALLKAKNPHP